MKYLLSTLILFLLSFGFSTAQLAEHVSYAIDSRIEGTTASISKAVFATQDHTNSVYVWNLNFWAIDINRDFVSPWNSAGGRQRAGALVSPQHFIVAKHFTIPNGSIIRFVKSDGTIINRSVLANRSLPDDLTISQDPIPDVNVGLLDFPIFDIQPVEIVPFEANTSLYNVPVVWFDQEEKGIVANMPSAHDFYHTYYLAAPPLSSKRYEYYEEAISGDSGSPTFIIVNNKLVLVGVMTFGGSGRGSSLNYYKSQTQEAMDILSSQNGFPLYTLKDADFSNVGFPDTVPVLSDVGTVQFDQGKSIQIQLKTTYGNAPLKFYLEPTAPSWLSINQNTGLITGMSNTIGTFVFQAGVLDSQGDFDVVDITLIINPYINLFPAITEYTTQASFEANTAFSIQFSAIGGNEPITWSAINSPSWLKMENGLLYYTGSPKNNKYIGIYTISVVVTDIDGDSDSTILTLEITKTTSTVPGKGRTK